MRPRSLVGATVGAILLLVFCLAPLLWFVRAAVTPEQDIFRHPARVLPDRITTEHFAAVLDDPSVHRYLANSFIVCTLSTALALLLGSAAAYGLARGRMRFGAALAGGLLAIHLLPGMTSVAALYRIVETARLLNTLTGVILIKAGSLTLVVWLLKSYFESIPPNLEDAARLDGCSGLRLFRKVVLPAAAPGLFAAGALLFVGSWNAFFLPYVLLRSPEKMTAAVGIYQYLGEHGFETGKYAAMTLVAIAPVMILFLVFQRTLRAHVFFRRT